MCVLFILSLFFVLISCGSFEIVGNTFMLDDVPFIILGGTINYYSIFHKSWEDYIAKVKSLGVNTVYINVPWALHQPNPNTYYFTDSGDIDSFLYLLEKHGLYVIISIGPFIGSHYSLGGLPPWLLSNDINLKIRSSDPKFMSKVEEYYNQLLPIIKPHLYSEGIGGTILMIQIESKFGDYKVCDDSYLDDLYNITKFNLNKNVIITTNDISKELNIICGSIPNTLPTITMNIDDNQNITSSIHELMKVKKNIPILVKYSIFNHPNYFYSKQRNYLNITKLFTKITEMLSYNISIILEPLVGGTNFGLNENGIDFYNNTYLVDHTVYYDETFIRENGDTGIAYTNLRNFLGEYSGPFPYIPSNRTKSGYGNLEFKESVHLFSILDTVSSIILTNSTTLLFNELNINTSGLYVLYRTSFKSSVLRTISLQNIHDRLIIYYNSKYITSLNYDNKTVTLNIGSEGGTLDLLVESIGYIDNPLRSTALWKGFSNFRINGATVSNFTIYVMEMEKIASLDYKQIYNLKQKTNYYSTNKTYGPIIYSYILKNGATDKSTYLLLNEWIKGHVYFNKFNIGRYWNVGPYCSLFVDGNLINKGDDNNVIILDEIPRFTMHDISTGDEHILCK